MRIREGHTIFELDSLPGCSQVVVSHGMFIGPKDRGQGFSKPEGFMRINRMQDLGWDYALCTVEALNTPQIKQLRENDWRYLDCFVSSKTGHNVFIYGRVLGPQFFNRIEYGMGKEFQSS